MNWDRDVPDGELRLVRPYTITGGRTRSAGAFLALEAIVTLTAAGRSTQMRHERAQVIAACASPCSVAEIAARVGFPVGVARVLVGDLLASGHVEVVNGRLERPDAELLSRVLERLEAL